MKLSLHGLCSRLHQLQKVGATSSKMQGHRPIVWVLKIIGTLGALGITWFALTIFLDEKRYRWLWLGSAALINVALLSVPLWPQITPFLRGYAVVHFLALLTLIL